MAWIESHEELGQHPKLLRLARQLDIPRAQAIGHLQYLWWWAMKYATEGDLSGMESSEIAEACTWDGDSETFVQALTGAGFLDQEGESLSIHDWSDYAGRLIQKRQANAERMRLARSLHVQNTSMARAGATVPNPTVPNQTITETTSPADETPAVDEQKIPSNLEGWLSALKTEKGLKNSVAVIAFAAHVLSGGEPTIKSVPSDSYGRAGKFCKRANDDYGYVMKLLWEGSASRPAGDLVNYVEGVLKNRNARASPNGRAQSVHERRLEHEKSIPIRKAQEI